MTSKPKKAAGTPAADKPTADPMSQFFTKEAANSGLKVPLVDPMGQKTDHWLEIYGVDSDQFRVNDARARRESARIAAIEDPTERDLAMVDLTRRLTASLVFNWSFDKPCTTEAVTEFFRQAPQVQEAVDFFASRRSFFFAKASATSSATRATNSGSTSTQKAAPSP
jgi:hypothetical protein